MELCCRYLFLSSIMGGFQVPYRSPEGSHLYGKDNEPLYGSPVTGRHNGDDRGAWSNHA